MSVGASALQRSRRACRPLAAWALTAGLAAGCGGGGRTAADELVVLIESPVVELDPRYAVTGYDWKASRLVCAALVNEDDERLEPRLELAEAARAVDPLTWELRLRRGSRFPDGAELDAEDVRYTFESLLDPAMKSPYRKNFSRLSRVEVLSRFALRFHLSEPNATFLTDLDFGIVPRRLAAAGGRFPDGLVQGAGPFYVEGRQGETVLLRRNPRYSAALGGPARTERLRIKTIRDDNSRLLALVGGSGDLTQNTVPPLLLDALAGRRHLRVEAAPAASFTYLGLNLADPLLADVRVRRAIAYALDRGSIVRTKLRGRAVLATGMLDPRHWAYDGAVARYGHDPARARALLDQAGFVDPDGPAGPRPRLRLTYKSSANKYRLAIARVIARQLAEVGIEVDLRSYEFATFLADINKGNFQLFTLQQPEVVEPNLYYPLFHSSRIPSRDAGGSGKNRFHLIDPELDRLLDLGRTQPDPAARRALYASVQRRLAELLPVVPLWHEDNVVVMRDDLRGYRLLPNSRLSALARTWKER